MAPAELEVEVVYSPAPGAVERVSLRLPQGSTALQAVDASGLLVRHGLDPAAALLGVWGRSCSVSFVLRERDRVEVYRPLTVDPKEARRLRYKRHRDGSTRG